MSDEQRKPWDFPRFMGSDVIIDDEIGSDKMAFVNNRASQALAHRIQMRKMKQMHGSTMKDRTIYGVPVADMDIKSLRTEVVKLMDLFEKANTKVHKLEKQIVMGGNK